MKFLSFGGLYDAGYFNLVLKFRESGALATGWNGGAQWDNPGHQWLDNILPWLSLPRFGQLLIKGYEGQTKFQFAVVTSALHQYRNRAGRYPARLADLAGKDVQASTLVDIFTGKELGYRVAKGGGGYELSSAGPFHMKQNNRGDSRGEVLVIREPLPKGKPNK